MIYGLSYFQWACIAGAIVYVAWRAGLFAKLTASSTSSAAVATTPAAASSTAASLPADLAAKILAFETLQPLMAADAQKPLWDSLMPAVAATATSGAATAAITANAATLEAAK